MKNVIQIEIKFLKPYFVHFLIILVIITGLFLSNYLISLYIIKTNNLEIETISDLSEEIYNSGSLESIKNLPLDAVLIKKLTSEIDGILNKTTDYAQCEVYFLQAKMIGNYPILDYGNIISGTVNLNIGEVWKVGQTRKNELGRYPSDIYYQNNGISITNKNLLYKTIHIGSYKECLIMEKILIYSYPLWSGHPNLIKPPGCKIFR